MLKRLFPLLLAILCLGPVSAAGAEHDGVLLLTANDNIGAAIAISEFVHGDDSESAQTVFLARDDNFPDALASGAVQAFGPLLYTGSSTLDPRTAAEIERVNPDTVMILGGTQAVSMAVEDDLRERGFEVDRKDGADRIDTAILLAQDFAPASPETTQFEVKIARAFPVPGSPDITPGFVDSLALGAANQAGDFEVHPVLLSHTDALSPATAGYLEDVRDTQGGEIGLGIVAGGPQALSDRVLADVDARVETARRVAGATRFETAVAIADFQETRERPIGVVVLADGTRADSWAPGFAAASLAAFGTTALVLSSGTSLPGATHAYLSAFDGNDGQPFILVCLPYVAEQACDEAASTLP